MSNSNIKGRGVQLAATRTNRIYLAGPMTGIAEYNFPAFNAEADRLRALGYHVENPADHGVVEGAEWGDYLRYDIGLLASCEAIAFLPGWSQSRGARLEKIIAEALGMGVLFTEGAEQTAPAQDEREAFNAEYDRICNRPLTMREIAWRMWQARANRPAQTEQQPAYVECRECTDCGHVGINDAHQTDATCAMCDWSGPSPVEDQCPDCGKGNAMGAACPKCSGRYRILAETHVAAPIAQDEREAVAAPKCATCNGFGKELSVYEGGIPCRSCKSDPTPAQDGRDLPDHLNDAIDNLVHDNYERSQAGSRNRQADADLIRAALAARPAQTEQQPVATWMGTDWNAQQQLIAHLCKLEPGTDLYAAPIAQTEQQPVAYLDLGIGGYMDLGTDLTDEQLAALPKGRHMLGIIGTYGLDGYAPAPANAELKPVAWMHDNPERFDVIHADVKALLEQSGGHLSRPLDKTEHYTIPLYAAPIAQAEQQPEQSRLVAALEQFADDSNWCYDTCNISRDVAKDALASYRSTQGGDA